MPTTIPAAKRRRQRHLRSVALFWLYAAGLMLAALAFFDMAGR